MSGHRRKDGSSPEVWGREAERRLQAWALGNQRRPPRGEAGMLESHLQEVEAGGASRRAWQQQRLRGWGARRVPNNHTLSYLCLDFAMKLRKATCSDSLITTEMSVVAKHRKFG